jgi:hypothetical protein
MLPASLLPLLMSTGVAASAPASLPALLPSPLAQEEEPEPMAPARRPSYGYLELGYDSAEPRRSLGQDEDRLHLVGSFELTEHVFGTLEVGREESTGGGAERRATHMSAGIGGRLALADGLDGYVAARLGTNELEEEGLDDSDYETLHLRFGLRYLVIPEVEVGAYFEHANAFGFESAPDRNTVQVLGRAYFAEHISIGIAWQQDDTAGSDLDSRALGVRLGYFF